MILKELRTRHFRGMGELDIPFHARMNVLVGPNGSGKSAILDCLAIMLSIPIVRLRPARTGGRRISDYDVSNGEEAAEIVVEVAFRNEVTSWRAVRIRGRRKNTLGVRLSDYKQLNHVAEDIRSQLESDIQMSIPLAVYYPVNRAVLDIPLRIRRRRHTFEQLSAYDGALTKGGGDFRIFFEWFRQREDLENEKRVSNSRHRDRQLQAVRGAIERFLPGFEGLRVRRSPLRMVVCKNGEELIVNQLSDGEKCLLAMVGDLARRLAIANPSLNQPHEGRSVVLVDEIDLHLHASWQRTIVRNLGKAFPNCQFVLTTHSPQVVSEVSAECVMGLERSRRGVRILRPVGTYGLDSNRILEDVMGVDERPKDIKRALKRLFLAIENGNIAEAYRQLKNLQAKIGSDPQLAKADAMIRRKEVLAR